MPTIVKLIWKCAMPTTKKLIQLCESLMIKAAKGHGMDTAIIRQVNTQYVISPGCGLMNSQDGASQYD
jgi:hypothetical protein